MDIFSAYCSDTLASNANQTSFRTDSDGIEIGLIFEKVYKGGAANRVFGFSSVIDSTFGDGTVTRANDICPPWYIVTLKAAVSKTCDPKEATKNEFQLLTFGGSNCALINGGDIVFSDPVFLDAKKDEYICLEIVFKGPVVPCHAESIVSLFRFDVTEYKPSANVPLPVFSGIERKPLGRIAFLGDSITQGIGTTFNSYNHYAAVAAETIGSDYAFWDLGIGYARGSDAATDGMWLSKAKHNDIVCVCFGVNDILQGHSAGQVKNDLTVILEKLHESGVKTVIQTVPPFDYVPEKAAIWAEVNDYIENTLFEKADAFFDTRTVLSADGKTSPMTVFGCHPNDEGNRLWGLALSKVISTLL